MTTPDPSHDPIAYVRGHLATRYVDPGILAHTLAAVLSGTPAMIVAPPGVGKTMAARAAWGLLPDIEPAFPRPPWAMDVLRSDWHGPPSSRPPLRMPHHTASLAGMVGGGTPLHPGEVTLATGGLLFLDEWPEFSRATQLAIVDGLRTGRLEHRRGGVLRSFPARCRVLASANPCPCGYLGHPERACICTPSSRARHDDRLATFLRLPGARLIYSTPAELVEPWRAALDDLFRRSEARSIFERPSEAVAELRAAAPQIGPMQGSPSGLA